MIRCQLRFARSWPSTATTPISIRRPISSSAGIDSRRIRSKYSERGSLVDSMIFITRRALISISRSSMYQPPTAIMCSISRSASSFEGFLTKPRSCSACAQRLGVVARGGVEGPLLEHDLLAVELLRHPEVEEGDAAVVHQDVVAGVGVGVEVLQVVDRAEAAAEDDLAEAAALLVRQLLDLLEADPLDAAR